MRIPKPVLFLLAILIFSAAAQADDFDSFFSTPSPAPAPVITSPATPAATSVATPTAVSTESAVSTSGAVSTTEVVAGTGEAAKPVDGYKNVPWGATVDQFKAIKSYTGSIETANNKIIISPSGLALAVIFEAKLKMNANTIFADPKYVPNKFSFADIDDISYVFYNGEFALATSFVSEKNYDQYLSRLSEKYPKVMSTTKTIAGKRSVAYEIVTTLFDKDHAKIFLVKKDRREKNKVVGSSVRVIYIANTYFNKIKTDLTEQAQKKRTIESDLEKLE